MHKIIKAAAVAAAALGLIVLPRAAQASSPEPTAAAASTVTYATLPLPPRVVGNSQVSKNAVDWLQLGSQARAEIRSLQAKADAAAAKATTADGKATEALNRPDRGESKQQLPFNPVTIEHVGGKFLERYTHVGDFVLPKGRWNIVAVAKFTRTADAADGDPAVRPMVGLRVGQDTETSNWGLDFGSIGGNDIAPYKGADLWGNTGGFVVQAESATPVDVNAFGYNDKRGTEGSGQISVQVTVFVTAA